MNKKERRRFWSKVKTASGDECWEWQRAITVKGGYGKFYLRGKYLRAHRAVWEMARGKIPDGMCVLHRCDNPACVRPSHLFLGTNDDNINDMMQKGRIALRSGENNPRARLTWEDVLLIREIAKKKSVPSALLAKRFGVSRGHINKIVSGKKWKTSALHEIERRPRASVRTPPWGPSCW